jgi:octaprenyl-diphosphate synthase
MSEDLLTILAPLTGRVNEMMKTILTEDTNVLGEAALYNLMGGGKRLRPLIFCLSHAALGGELDDDVLKLAASFEFLHMASLMHDDIVDQADTRRGRPAAHHVFGVPETVMAADYLLAKASLMALSKRNIDVAIIMAQVIKSLSLGELWEMKACRKADLTEQEYLDIILHKTAVLLEAVSWSAGMLLEAGQEKTDALKDYGRHVGLAFQIMDDILDYKADQSKLGKPVGQDLEEGRITLPFILTREKLPEAERRKLVALGEKLTLSEADKREIQTKVEEVGALDEALEKAESYVETAVQALSPLPETKEKDILIELARYTVRRDR